MKIIKDSKAHNHNVSSPEKPKCLPQERIDLIEKEAYLVASTRGIGNGDALSDWLGTCTKQLPCLNHPKLVQCFSL